MQLKEDGFFRQGSTNNKSSQVYQNDIETATRANFSLNGNIIYEKHDQIKIKNPRIGRKRVLITIPAVKDVKLGIMR